MIGCPHCKTKLRESKGTKRWRILWISVFPIFIVNTLAYNYLDSESTLREMSYLLQGPLFVAVLIVAIMFIINNTYEIIGKAT